MWQLYDVPFQLSLTVFAFSDLDDVGKHVVGNVGHEQSLGLETID